jgi:hypothetical protein
MVGSHRARHDLRFSNKSKVHGCATGQKRHIIGAAESLLGPIHPLDAKVRACINTPASSAFDRVRAGEDTSIRRDDDLVTRGRRVSRFGTEVHPPTHHLVKPIFLSIGGQRPNFRSDNCREQ